MDAGFLLRREGPTLSGGCELHGAAPGLPPRFAEMAEAAEVSRGRSKGGSPESAHSAVAMEDGGYAVDRYPRTHQSRFA
jgi:hypothetical protein